MDAEQRMRILGSEIPSSLQLALDLKQVARCDIFIGSEDAIGQTYHGRVFGGQVLAQALVAALRTVPDDLHIHSLHGYFLLVGTSGVELLFEVDRVRDGRSFATRSVKALQQNKAIFQLTASFHKPEWGPAFQMPGTELVEIVREKGFTGGVLPTPQELVAKGAQIERGTFADNKGDTQCVEISRGVWWCLRYYRHRTRLSDDTPGVHASILAWLTDSYMVEIVCVPHESRHGMEFSQRYSLDHSIHFHTLNFRADEWMVFFISTSVSGGSRGLARIQVYTLDGRLVATVTQEAVMRVPKEVAGKLREAEEKLSSDQGAGAGMGFELAEIKSPRARL